MDASCAEGIIAYARRFTGIPYVYGANGPHAFDCSGFANFILRKYGVVGPHEDLTAQGLFEKLVKRGTRYPPASKIFPAGALVFYGPSVADISHVAFVADKYSILECGGGTAKTDSIEKARATGACVRETALQFRSDVVAVVLPNYPA